MLYTKSNASKAPFFLESNTIWFIAVIDPDIMN